MTRACTIFKYAYPLKASPWSTVSIILPRCEHWSALCDSIPADLTFFGGDVRSIRERVSIAYHDTRYAMFYSVDAVPICEVC